MVGLRIKIYVEGGGDYSQLKTLCRKGFSRFFERAGLQGKMPQIVACGSRRDAFSDFCTALKRSEPNVLPILLVDSEDRVTTASPWEHVAQRAGDQWTRPSAAKDAQLHFMVQCMEAWFLADRDAVRQFFGQGFIDNSLPAERQIESVGKAVVLDSLKLATRMCKTKSPYSKGEHAFQILANVDPSKVETASPYAKRLLDTLRSLRTH
jgi:hypothetical protein